jgi:putative tricarboxylic transport membrane protein
MRIASRLALPLLLIGCVTLGLAGPAAAYPDKPLTLIVPYPAGGAADLIARTLADMAKPHFPQPIAVVNRPGGGGTVAAAEVVRARPDGYTLGLLTIAIMTLQPHRVSLPYKTPDDYASIIEVMNVPVVLVVRTDAPWKTLKDYLEAARANPGKIRAGTPGIGTTTHIAIEMLKDQAGVDITHVPYAGNAESVPALLGGHIESIMLNPSDVIPHLRAGKVRFLATSEPRRSPVYPDVPTLAELGYPDAGIGVAYSVFGPKGTPPQVVQVVHDAFKRVIDTDAYKKFALETSSNVEYRGPVELRRQLDRDYVFFGKAVDKLKLRK